MPAPWARGAEVRVVGKLHGVDVVNVWTFATNTVVNDGPPVEALLLALAQAVRECVHEFLLPAVTSDYTLTHVDARAIFPTPSDPVIATALVPNVGLRGPTSYSFGSALVSIRTGGGSRRGRGKKFLPPPGEADILNSQIDDAVLVLVAAFLACIAEKFFEGQATTDWRVGVYSRTNDAEVGGTFDNSFRLATQMSPVKLAAHLSSRKIEVAISFFLNVLRNKKDIRTWERAIAKVFIAIERTAKLVPSLQTAIDNKRLQDEVK